MKRVMAASLAAWVLLGCGGAGGAAPSPDASFLEDASTPDGALAPPATPLQDGGAFPTSPSDASAMTGDAFADANLPGWQLTWSDEFEGLDGSSLDPSKWTYDIGNGDTGGDKGWGNNELEYYTDSPINAVVEGGWLVITGTPQGAAQYTCWNGACPFTSARVTTLGKFAQQYGRFEARMKLPGGQGVWPAFWMMGASFPQVGWPNCGEIDVMENIGSEPWTVHGTTHGPTTATGPEATTYLDVGITAADSLPDGGAALADGFHVYAIEWETSAIRFYVDGALYETVTPADLPAGATWVWNTPFFVLLNFAIGGDWPGSPDKTTVWPQTLEVDYVRVYRASP